MKKIVDYFKGVKKEISRIKWTSKKELLKYSISTIVFMLFFVIKSQRFTYKANPIKRIKNDVNVLNGEILQ